VRQAQTTSLETLFHDSESTILAELQEREARSQAHGSLSILTVVVKCGSIVQVVPCAVPHHLGLQRRLGTNSEKIHR